MNRILCPSDFSANADNALVYACHLAKLLEAEIDLLHVYTETAEEVVAQQQVVHSDTAAVQTVRNRKWKEHAVAFRLQHPKSSQGVVFNYINREGDPVEGIVDYSSEMTQHMIVMGTQGASNHHAGTMGSIASQVITRVSTPVLAVPAGAEYGRINKIAYAVDYENYDKFTLHALSAFASRFEAEIVVLHVSNEPDYFDPERWSNFQSTLNETYEYDKMHFEFLEGDDIARTIERYVADNGVDILAMLTHHYHLINRVYGSSMTERMSLTTRTPLLAFHD